MTGGMSVVAVDDEQPALEDLARLLRSSPRVGRVDTATSGADALSLLADHSYDAMFVDVRMPGLDGVELTRVLRRFERPPAVVFVSAYDDAAVNAFALRVVDYLMKPVSRPRLEESLIRIATGSGEEPHSAPAAPQGHDLIAARARGGRTRLVVRSSVLYVESSGDYVRLVCEHGRYLVRAHISELEHRWRSAGFVRVHRQYLANLSHALEVETNLNGTASLIFPGGQSIPVSRRQVAALMHALAA